MTDRHESPAPALAWHDPLEIARAAVEQCREDEIRARAQLARNKVLAELSPAVAPHVRRAQESHTLTVRNSARWQRMLVLIEEDALLNGGGDGE